MSRSGPSVSFHLSPFRHDEWQKCGSSLSKRVRRLKVRKADEEIRQLAGVQVRDHSKFKVLYVTVRAIAVLQYAGYYWKQ
jgi:hypothetical protein